MRDLCPYTVQCSAWGHLSRTRATLLNCPLCCLKWFPNSLGGAKRSVEVEQLSMEEHQQLQQHQREPFATEMHLQFGCKERRKIRWAFSQCFSHPWAHAVSSQQGLSTQQLPGHRVTESIPSMKWRAFHG